MDEIKFQPKTAREELEILLSSRGNFDAIRQYLEPLIYSSVEKAKFGFNDVTKQEVQKGIEEDIPIAVERFLSKKNVAEEISFSTYFTWYIAQRINARLKKRSVWEKIRAALSGS